MHICEMQQRHLTFAVKFEEIVLRQFLLCSNTSQVARETGDSGCNRGKLQKVPAIHDEMPLLVGYEKVPAPLSELGL